MPKEISYFILSLDTELHWGYNIYPESCRYKLFKNNEDKIIDSIRNILELLEKYQIPATWAIVGKIFFEHSEIIDMISNHTRQEIGYHSFSHLPFNKCDYDQADKEIKKGIEIREFESFVFPENKIKYIDLLKKYGFKIYRGPNLAGKNVNKSLLIRIINHVSSKISAPPVVPIWRECIWEIPASMMLFGNLFSRTLVYRARSGIKKTIKEKKIFHIFMHPEDLLIRPDIICQLEEILKFVSEKRQKDEIRTITMGELAAILKKNKIDEKNINR